jgi:hypothetical protein
MYNNVKDTKSSAGTQIISLPSISIHVSQRTPRFTKEEVHSINELKGALSIVWEKLMD